MTYYKIVTLMCDGPGEHYPNVDECLETYQYDRGQATEAREYAKQSGWVNEGSEDYCPDCAEALGLSSTESERTNE